MGLSRRAYAAHRQAKGLPGVTDTAVRKAIASGRITTLPDGTIDPARADAEWRSGTDAAFQREPEAVQQGIERARETAASEERRPVPPAAVDAVNASVSDAADLTSGGLTLAKVNIAEKAIRIKRQQLRYKIETEAYVDRVAAEADVFAMAREERDHWMQLPARVSATMAAELECDAHALEVLLDQVIRDHLALRSETKIDLRPSKL